MGIQKNEKVRLILVFAVSILVAASFGSFVTQLYSGSKTRDVGGQLGLVQGELARTKVELERAQTGKSLECAICHEIDQLKGFHYPSRIQEIQKKRVKPRRICIDCHASPDTLAETILGDDGVYDIPVPMPHEVHKAKLESAAMKCETCHIVNDEFTTPVAREGEILVCELCHSRGNFITIHIEGRITEENPNIEPVQYPKLQCTICHVEDPATVHGEATSKLGQV